MSARDRRGCSQRNAAHTPRACIVEEDVYFTGWPFAASQVRPSLPRWEMERLEWVPTVVCRHRWTQGARVPGLPTPISARDTARTFSARAVSSSAESVRARESPAGPASAAGMWCSTGQHAMALSTRLCKVRATTIWYHDLHISIQPPDGRGRVVPLCNALASSVPRMPGSTPASVGGALCPRGRGRASEASPAACESHRRVPRP